jgi:hypothetical protein
MYRYSWDHTATPHTAEVNSNNSVAILQSYSVGRRHEPSRFMVLKDGLIIKRY